MVDLIAMHVTLDTELSQPTYIDYYNSSLCVTNDVDVYAFGASQLKTCDSKREIFKPHYFVYFRT